VSSEELIAERNDLLLGLEDLEKEHDAGDISDEDYSTLRDRYTYRAARAIRAIGAGDRADENAVRTDEAAVTAGIANSEGGTPDTSKDEDASSIDGGTSVSGSRARSARRRLSRPVTLVTICALLALVALSAVLLSRGTSSRLPGETATGSVSLSRAQQIQRTLSQAQTLESQGDASRALVLYEQVLSEEPNQEQALSEAGWLEFEAGVQAKNASLLSKGQADEQKAEAVDLSSYSPHLYLGSMLLVEGDSTAAVAQYRSFLADNPPTSVVVNAKPFIERAFEGAHLSPPALPGS
jgi:tetratricopeptide (TPR) repeat protein